MGLMLSILFRVEGGGLGGIFGQADTVYRTRRGVEKTLFQLTIVLAVLFVIISIVALKFA
jgi:preprotein translocase subunit SecG